MNLLVFDAPPTAANLIRSILVSQRFPVSLSFEIDDAIRKISTALIDGIIIGPSGVPWQLAAFLAGECPGLPVVLAGATGTLSPGFAYETVLTAPLSARKLVSAVRRMEAARRARIESLPTEVATENLAIACRLAEISVDGMILCGESDEFRRWAGSSPAHVQALVAGTPVRGNVVSSRTDRLSRLPRVDVRLSSHAARPILAQLLKQ